MRFVASDDKNSMRIVYKSVLYKKWSAIDRQTYVLQHRNRAGRREGFRLSTRCRQRDRQRVMSEVSSRSAGIFRSK